MFNFPVPQIDWATVLPILIVAGTGLLGLVIEMIRPKATNNLIVIVTLLGLVLAGYFVLPQFYMPEGETFAGMVIRDRISLIVQLLLIGCAFLSILFSEGYLREKKIPFGEFYPLLVWSTMGAMIMATTKNFLMIFIGLEVLSIALYVMAGMSRQEERSEESALKYFLLGAFASGFLLYGIAFVYGATGSLHMDAIYPAWQSGDPNNHVLLLFGLGLMLVGLCFKSSFVPFHQWTPDVYQGAPTNVAAFMAAGSKIGAIAALWRVLDGCLAMSSYWLPALFWIAIITMTVGNLIALLQKDVKRILGYSSIAHAGYVLVGICAYFKDPANGSFATVAFYLAAYALMTIGAFAAVSMVAKGGQEETTLKDLHGLWSKSPFAAFALIIFMCSLIGIPPTAGFVGKLMIFQDALRVGFTGLAVVLAINSAISAYYYLGIILSAFVAEDGAETNRLSKLNFGLTGTFAICIIGILAGFAVLAPLTAR